MRMHRRLSTRLGIAALAALCIAAPASALADDVASTGTVDPGTLSLTTTTPAPTFGVTLNGTDQAGTYDVPLTLTDSTGSGSGWNATITSTRFTTGGATPRTLAATASTITGVTSVCATGTCTMPTNAVAAGALQVPAGATAPAPVKFVNAAADSGMGQFTVTPTVSVAIPANAYAGTYTTTLTLASVSGP
jgi:hypothetical protein